MSNSKKPDYRGKKMDDIYEFSRLREIEILMDKLVAIIKNKSQMRTKPFEGKIEEISKLLPFTYPKNIRNSNDALAELSEYLNISRVESFCDQPDYAYELFTFCGGLIRFAKEKTSSEEFRTLTNQLSELMKAYGPETVEHSKVDELLALSLKLTEMLNLIEKRTEVESCLVDTKLCVYF